MAFLWPNDCGVYESAVRSFDAVATDVLRHSSMASLASGTSEDRFASGGPPWVDPDDVLRPDEPSLFYDEAYPGIRTTAVKQEMTVRIERR